VSSDPGAVPWRPANATESHLLDAMERDDRQEFFATLARVPLYVPQSVPEPIVAMPTSDHHLTYTLADVTYLLLFTSVETLRASVGDLANGYVETTFGEIAEKLTEPGVRLAFNLGTPIDAWVDIDSVARAAAGEIDVATGTEMAELLAMQDPANAAAVEDAVEKELESYVDDYIESLINGDVLVENTGTGTEAAWRIKPVDGVPTIEVFSAPELVPEGTSTVSVRFTALAKRWPDQAEMLSVNPGTPLAFTMPAEVIEAFATPMPRPDA
jgi:hypothetical protein